MNRVGLLGLGHATPSPATRPHVEHDRIVPGGPPTAPSALPAGQPLSALMAQAARRALDDAGLLPAEVDRLYGFGLLSEQLAPNCLFAVHRDLGLPAATWVVPVATDFTCFLTAVALAQEAVLAERARHVLVVAGSHLSHAVEPGSEYAATLGDAAAAAVVGRSPRDTIVDCGFDVDSALYRGTVIEAGGEGGAARVAFDLRHLPALREHRTVRPPRLIAALLERNNLWRQDITVISHQPSRGQLDLWRSSIAPAAYLDTLDVIGNATAASVPATLSLCRREIQTPYVMLMSTGPGMHVVAMLLRRGQEGTGATRRMRHA